MKLPIKPKIEPILNVPKRSPARLPIAEPHAPAGPNNKPNNTGKRVAGLISVMPGMIGIALNGNRKSMYIPAHNTVSATIVLYFHILIISFTKNTSDSIRTKQVCTYFTTYMLDMSTAFYCIDVNYVIIHFGICKYQYNN